MDGWMDGWMNGWMMGGWMDGWLCFVRMDLKFTFLKLDVTLSNRKKF
jgi:hypothetical protein